MSTHSQINHRVVCHYCGYPFNGMSQLTTTKRNGIIHLHFECSGIQNELMVKEYHPKWIKLMLQLHQKYPEHSIPKQFKEYLPPESTV